MLIYDTVRMDYLDLGKGRRPMFSPDSRLAVWVEAVHVSRDQPGEAWVIDLQTRERWQVGQARFISFIDERHVEGLVASMPADGTRAMADVYTGSIAGSALT